MSDLGVQRGKVIVVPFDSSWKKEFEKEKEKLLDTFGNKIINIEHIGSTAIPGLCAKPIIDINVAIHSLEQAQSFIEPLEQLGYEYIAERHFKDRYFFPKGTKSNRTHHLNLVEIGSQTGWINPLLFRDYLIHNSEMRDYYCNLKRNLSYRYSDNREKYTERKSDFVRTILEKANNQYSDSK